MSAMKKPIKQPVVKKKLQIKKPALKIVKPETITLTIEKSIAAEAETQLAERGSNLETWLKLQLKAFSLSKKIMLKLCDKITFGKYQGELIEDIVRADPGYIAWIVRVSTNCSFDMEVLELLEKFA